MLANAGVGAQGSSAELSGPPAGPGRAGYGAVGCVGEAAGRALARDRPKQGECGWARRAAARGREIGKEGRECWAEGEKKGGPSGQMRERFSSSSFFFKILFYF